MIIFYIEMCNIGIYCLKYNKENNNVVFKIYTDSLVSIEGS